MTDAKRDLINSIIILIFCGIAYYGTLLIPIRNISQIESDFFPKIIISIMFFLSICLLIKSLYKIIKESDYSFSFSVKRFWKENKKIILLLLIFIVYIIFLEYIGYFISTPIFLYLTYKVLVKSKQKQWAVLLGIVILTGLLYWVFQELLYVFLPPGIF